MGDGLAFKPGLELPQNKIGHQHKSQKRRHVADEMKIPNQNHIL